MIKILIVEDDLSYARKLKNQLKTIGNVEIKMNLNNACDYVMEHEINFLILDLKLGNEDGKELLEFLLLSNIMIPHKLILSFTNTQSVIEECYRYNICCYFKKKSTTINEIKYYIMNSFKLIPNALLRVKLNEEKQGVEVGEAFHHLSELEYKTLKKFLEFPNIILHYNDFKIIWKSENRLFTHKGLYNIVYKLKKIPDLPPIKGIRNKGYVLGTE